MALKILVTGIIKEWDIEAVIHFAAHAYVEESVRQPQKYFDNNVTKTLALLDTLLEAGVSSPHRVRRMEFPPEVADQRRSFARAY